MEVPEPNQKLSATLDEYISRLPISQKEAERLMSIQEKAPENRSLADWTFIDEICSRLIAQALSKKKRGSPKQSSYMDAYQHPEALEALQKEQLVQLARHIGLETSLRGKAKTAPALKAEIRNYLNYCEQLTIPEVMPMSG